MFPAPSAVGRSSVPNQLCYPPGCLAGEREQPWQDRDAGGGRGAAGTVPSHPWLAQQGSGTPGCEGANPEAEPTLLGAAEPQMLVSEPSNIIYIPQMEPVLEMPGSSGGACRSGGSSACFGFHLSALIFRALQFGQTNISRVHGESMRCSIQEIIHLSPLSETSLQTGINKSFIVLHHPNTPKPRGKKNATDNLFSKFYPFISCSQASADIRR